MSTEIDMKLPFGGAPKHEIREDAQRPVGRLVISVRQPWAWLIMHGGKDIENRSWPTKVRGRVFIHASKGVTKREWEDAWDYVRQIAPDIWAKAHKEIEAGTIERGGIVGSVEIVDCVNESDSPWYMGQYGFVLRNPEPMEFRPMKGRLGFFKI